ncbi:serine/threonine-protein kinase PknD [Chlamydiifrater phoenicopteri]|uniref:serine/threonine-protein kinase PknD n=1 Tax=Chlamydiifrater phoenicopteri TaxID=2681469 RepID=UPI001BCFC5A2|nr:serine/threonine-protein kinase PknD [Chlamydiifrater phoenicopteri]
MKDNGYQIIRLIGKGGMGEVYLAYDPIYDRKVALKRIRSDLPSSPVLKQRFLREPRIAGRLVHPGVVPVYSIREEEDHVYYTMPYIEGKTLKSLFKEVWNKDLIPQTLKEKTSVSSLVSIFYNVCKTIEYVHSQGVLHRDLKPDNILLGLFGEVVILDWGAAIEKQYSSAEDYDEDIAGGSHGDREGFSGITVPGKVVGTLDYMAPERLNGEPATELTDIYSLGVMLYQMLTLSFPFPKRRKMKASKLGENILPPETVAPYREISPILSKVVMKALEFDPALRYQSVAELCSDLASYLSGTSGYSEEEVLFLSDKSVWKFSEPILLSTYFPKLKGASSLWYELSVSKQAWFSDVRFRYTIPKNHIREGLGVLFPVALHTGVSSPLGYGLWLALQNNEVVFSLTKNGTELAHQTISILGDAVSIPVLIEKEETKITFKIGDFFLFSCTEDLLRGGHVGILSCDPKVFSGEIFVSEINNSLQVSCLSIPDAFLAERFYDHALALYRRIAEAFPGRREGCEARFRAGMTLLENYSGKKGDLRTDSRNLLTALEEFSYLHNTILAPLEYLGKSFVYHVMGDYSEESKCLALGLKRYSTHQEVYRLKEQLLYRVHESSRKDPRAFLRFLSLALGVSPEAFSQSDRQRFFQLLQLKIDATFLFDDRSLTLFDSKKIRLLLSYWTGESTAVLGFVEKDSREKDFWAKALTVLFINSPKQFATHVQSLIDEEEIALDKHLMLFSEWLSMVFTKFDDVYSSVTQVGAEFPESCLVYLFEILLLAAPLTNREEQMLELIARVEESICQSTSLIGDIFAEKFLKFYAGKSLSEIKFSLDCKKIRLLLFLGDRKRAGALLASYNENLFIDDAKELFVLYGCWLALTEGEELARVHFLGVNESSDYSPKVLLARLIVEGSRFPLQSLLEGEKRELLGQQLLYYKCLGDVEGVSTVLRQYREMF